MTESNKKHKTKNKKLSSLALKLLGNEKWQGITIPVLLILLSFLAASIIILILGKNPLMAFYNLLQGAGIMPKASYAGYKSMLTDFLTLLNYMTPLIFASLAVAVALKGGLFNIGVSGQMLFAGYFATVIIGYSGLSAIIAKPLVLVVGIIAGALLGGLVGLLKYKFNINEVVSSIMFNYIIQYVMSFFIHSNYIDPVSRQSTYISSASRLTKAVGSNYKGASYAGINVGKTMVLTMVLSGAFAGLAGVTYYLGYFASIQPRVLPAMGFNAIAVALLGNTNPYGIIASSLIISIIDKGSTYMSSIAGVRQEIASVITGLILLFSACTAFIQQKIRLNKDRLEYKPGKEIDR